VQITGNDFQQAADILLPTDQTVTDGLQVLPIQCR